MTTKTEHGGWLLHLEEVATTVTVILTLLLLLLLGLLLHLRRTLMVLDVRWLCERRTTGERRAEKRRGRST